MIAKIRENLKDTSISSQIILEFDYPIIIGYVIHNHNAYIFVFNILIKGLKLFGSAYVYRMYKKIFVVKKNETVMLYDLNTMEEILIYIQWKIEINKINKL